jgi:hypothetical protein
MASGDLRAVLLSKPNVDGLFARQVVERLSTKPFAPVTVPLAAIAGYAGATKVLWHGQAAKYFGDDVVKRGAAGAQLFVAVSATVITAD